jgi:lia operon protein LiaG
MAWSQSGSNEVSFTMDGISNVELRGSYVGVYVAGTTSSTLSFDGYIKGDTDDVIEYSRSGNSLKIWVTSNSRNGWSWNNNTSAKLELKLPNGVDLLLTNSSGSVKVENLQNGDYEIGASSGSLEINKIVGDLVANTSSGSIELGDVKGRTSVKSTSGSLRISQITGDLNYKSTSGSVAISNIASAEIKGQSTSGSQRLTNVSGGINLSSSSGSINGSGVSLERNSYFESTSGGINLTVLNDLEKLQFDAKTTSGGIKIGTVKSDRRLELGGSAGSRVTLIATSGSITVRN